MKTYANALILGMGASGCAAAQLLLSEGTHVCVCDASPSPSLAESANMLKSAGAEVRLGNQSLPHRDFDVCVISPGIPVMSTWGIASQTLAAETISELELGFSRCALPVIAVTGTNGKSTCAKLISDMLSKGGQRVQLGGNYGTPFCHLVRSQAAYDWVVVEVSSFQLEAVDTFRPRIGVLLNIQPDHLTRHGSMREYARLKMEMFARMGKGDAAVVPASHLSDVRAQNRTRAGGRDGADEVHWLSFGTSGDVDFRYTPGKVSGRLGPLPYECELSGSGFDNVVLGQAAAAAAAACGLAGVSEAHAEAALHAFEPLPHRMESVGLRAGVHYVNDSKATNLAATMAALDMCEGGVHLIAGGQLKEGNLKSFKEKLGNKVRCAYLIGEASDAMHAAWGDAIECRLCGDLRTAVESACASAVKGETVLLSPGCASFDQFSGFGARGQAFREAVALIGNMAISA